MKAAEYDEYRPSDVPWVRRLPAAWRTVPFFTVMRETRRPNLGMAESNLLSLSFGRIVRKDIAALGGLLPESFETYQIVEQSDIVFRLTDLQNDQRSLRTAIAMERGIITSAYGVATPTGVEPRFADYLMRAYDTAKVFYAFGGGVRQSIRLSDIARMPVVVPSLDEQRAIVTFLDAETAKVDGLIEEQEGLVGTLRERRHALITHSVSGDWLPVPFVRCMTRQVDYRGATPRKVDPGIQLVTARNVKPGWIDYETSQEFIDPIEYEDVMRRGLPVLGDLLFTMEAPLGNIAVVDRTDIALAQRVIKWTVNRSMARPRFLMYAALGGEFQAQLKTKATGSTALGIKASKLPELRIPLPPLEVQQRISESLDDQTRKIDALIAEAEGLVAVAKERRSALITAAVTGQIDVRGEVA